MRKTTMRLSGFALLFLTACTTSSGVIATGPDTYNLSMGRMSGLDPEALNSRMRRDAQAFCTKKGLTVEEVNAVDAGTGKPGALRDRSSMSFKCVPG